jgi:hypothetical protein
MSVWINSRDLVAENLDFLNCLLIYFPITHPSQNLFSKSSFGSPCIDCFFTKSLRPHGITFRSQQSLCHQQHFLIFDHFGVVDFFLLLSSLPNNFERNANAYHNCSNLHWVFFYLLGIFLILTRLGLTAPTGSTHLGNVIHDLLCRVSVVLSARTTLSLREPL